MNMKISSFICTDFFSLPKKRNNSKDFKEYVFKILDEFLQKLHDLNETDCEFEDCIKKPISNIITTQEHLVGCIKETIENYYNGKPSYAFISLTKGLKSDKKNLEEEMYLYRFINYHNFYRIRTEGSIHSSLEFFHIPFHLRGKVKSQRFSIPGFPSLYIGTTLHVCWEELNRPKFDTFQAVRLQNVEHFRVLNLVPPHKKYPNRLYNYLMSWPIIFTSSIKVNYPDDSFKPEYIVPQLLLQWIRNKTNIDGIMYQTTHLNSENSKLNKELINVVIPVKENKTSGHCNELKKLFEITPVYSFQLDEVNTHIPRVVSEVDVLSNTVVDIEEDKLSESYLELDKIENILLNMQTQLF